VSFWCDAGELRTQDCRAIGTSCEFLAESGGFRCSPLGGADPGNGGGADPGNGGGADPGNGGGADPGNGAGGAFDPGVPDDDPLPPDEEPPPPGNDPAPPAGDACGGIDYLGECQGDTARYCVDNQVVEVDCAGRGQTCGYISDVVGYYCIDVRAAIPVDECEGLDYLGECRGDTAAWCDAGQLYTLDCAAQGEVCDWISDAGGYFCTTP
jgi:hypothetical protein